VCPVFFFSVVKGEKKLAETIYACEGKKKKDIGIQAHRVVIYIYTRT
jgi:hypothetical protein